MSTGSADEPVLDTAQVCVLADRIEAGVLAAAMLADPDVAWAGDASPTELTLLAEQGKRAQWRFVGANLGLVGLVTRSFAGSGTPNPDLFQEGCLGLITAVQRFDHRRGLRFSTYALYWVRAAVGAASARQVGAVQVPISRAEQLRTVHGLEAELAQELGRPATVVELADGLGRTSAWTSALLGQRPPQSLDALDQVGREAVERIESAEEAGAALDWVKELLEWLPDLERQVIGLRMGFLGGRHHSRADVARSLGQPVGRVRRTELRALERLREHCPQQALDQL